ncbi:MAG: F0F1 ATP synthase subunit A [Patescibacteria group bacterium]|jgi:F-type H+-transporting ATPase subunit a
MILPPAAAETEIQATPSEIYPVKSGEAGAHSSEQFNEIKTESTLFSEQIFKFHNFPITNSLLNTWLVVLLVVIFGLFLRSRIKLVPKGVQNAVEAVIEMLLDIFDSVTGSRPKTLKYFPFVLSFFVFILLNNWLGLLPGVGSIGQVAAEHGEKVFIPFFRGGTADLNTTLALAIIGVVFSHIFSVIALGFWKYINKFINIKALLEIPKKVIKDPAIIFVNPIKVFVGLIEIVGEAAKVASLSFRLFGNIFAGEVLLASMSALLAFGLPIPFMFLEIIVGLVQAFIFAVLILAYLSMNTVEEEH